MRVLVLGCVIGVIAAVMLGAFWLPSGAASPSQPAIILDAATTTIRWAGYSTSTYTGNIGNLSTGLKAGNQICNANYPGSHWANSLEITKIGSSYPWTSTAWIANLYIATSSDCVHFTSNNNTYFGSTVTSATFFPGGDHLNASTCGNFWKLACVFTP
jgi:hypothetical protein